MAGKKAADSAQDAAGDCRLTFFPRLPFFNLPLPFFLVAFGPDGSPLHYNLAASMDLAQPPAI